MSRRWILLVCVLLQAIAIAEEHTDSSDPLSVALSVGHERRIDWPAGVEVALPSYLQSVLRVQSVKRSTYWLASMPFQATRVLVRNIDTGDTWLLAITATQNDATLPPIKVSGDVDTAPIRQRPPYVQLVRTAARALYSPARLVEKPLGFVREPVRRDNVALLIGAGTSATPLAQWRYRGHYVTAVELGNLATHPIELGVQLLRGDWLAAAFMHFRLQANGSDGATTVVYLVSEAPFNEMMRQDADAR